MEGLNIMNFRSSESHDACIFGRVVTKVRNRRFMKVTKHYEQDHVMVYVEEGDMRTCITLDSDRQMRRLGEGCDLARGEPNPFELSRA